MTGDARGVESVPFAQYAFSWRPLLASANLANGALTGNAVLQFNVTGFDAKLCISTGSGNGTLNVNAVEESADGTTYTTMSNATVSSMTANQTQTLTIRVTKPYLRLNGNISGGAAVVLQAFAFLAF